MLITLRAERVNVHQPNNDEVMTLLTATIRAKEKHEIFCFK